MSIKINRIEVDDEILRHRKIARSAFRNLLAEKLRSAGIVADVDENSQKNCLRFNNRNGDWIAVVPENVPISVSATQKPLEGVTFGSNVTVGPNVFAGGEQILSDEEIQAKVINIIIAVAQELW